MDVDRLLYWFLTRSVTEKFIVIAMFVLLMLGVLFLVVLALNAVVADFAIGLAPTGLIALYLESET